jgi:endoglucanase Acf2
MESKQTAIDWLVEQIFNDVDLKDGILKLAIQQAKEKEKEQIMKAARQCHFEGLRQTGKNSEEYLKYGNDYYNQTYNK